MQIRETWGSRIGVILAVAGSAVGLGNFLRFPAKAVQNGGGAFLIPYFVALLLLGIPLMWLEWGLGRLGGRHGHGTAPGAFEVVTGRPWARYAGVVGLVAPFVILIYYMYIESWTLAYTWYSFTGAFAGAADQASMKEFLSGYQGLQQNRFFSGIGPAYLFFVITFLVNFWFIRRGVRGGIELLSKVAMPVLVLLGILLAARVLTLGTPDQAVPERSVANALGFVWNPDFSQLLNAKVWLEAAGQIFFTLSVGIGVILTYASYLKKDDDIVLSGFSAASTNEFCEVILGGSVVIPAAFIFFGASGALEAARSGAFNLGFVSMPLIFGHIPAGPFFSGIWFLLLFIAGITSSVSLIQPAVAFLQDELQLSRERATAILGLVVFLCCQPCIFFLGNGFIDELDFWGGTFFLVLAATLETVFFVWVYGLDRAWQEIHQGAAVRIPRLFRFILKYVTPVYLLVLLAAWSWQQGVPVALMRSVAEADRPFVWGARLLVVGLIAVALGLVHFAWRRRALSGGRP